MEERNLIKQGGGGYTIYLPKKWVESKGLKEKDSIYVHERNSALVLESKQRSKKKGLVKIDSNNKEDLQTIITHFYREGFEEITIENVDSASFRIISEVVNNMLIGFEIIDRNPDKCVVGNVSEPTNQRYDAMLQRVFLITQEILKIIHEDGSSAKYPHMKEVEEMRGQLDKLVLFCRRVVMKEQAGYNETLSWELLTFLKNTTRAAYYCYKYMSKNKVKVGKDTIGLFKEIEIEFGLIKTAYYEKSLDAIHDINRRKKRHFEIVLSDFEKIKGKENVVFSYGREILRNTQTSASPIISFILEEKFNPIQ